MKSIEVTVIGIVQGVFFRISTLEKATSIGIKGWVKNSPDGSVLIRAEGTEKNISEFLDWCRIGSKNAVVKNVLIKEKGYEGFEGFKVIR
ncbi:acylphosphatase [Reichenbachiella sp. MALMAid0571]|uniref:acylphosphatase n=1 Tax=Reichenbachiella sp. MALMAid0571 TaxID=3143939 RepID=UPI0032DE6413